MKFYDKKLPVSEENQLISAFILLQKFKEGDVGKNLETTQKQMLKSFRSFNEHDQTNAFNKLQTRLGVLNPAYALVA